jgi:DNA-binding response OmpR family regulator
VTGEGSIKAKPGSVLIVEDDARLVDTITRNLVARGYQTQAAPDVGRALAAIRDRRPGLILLDIDLPDGCGWDVLRAMPFDTGCPVPVIVISGLRPNQRLVQELNCVAVLEKPFPMEALIRLVREQLDSQAANPKTELGTSRTEDPANA